ncbi:DUF2079 domain-containing protein [Psychromarinibacter sp. S121]|uniref:DUF2079 domain-containing protein n=1 Tax=Psychromarinibacter sp. S121 TaxID=3415127 RepID=UPI003C7E1F06
MTKAIIGALRRRWPEPGSLRERRLAQGLAVLLVLLCVNAKVIQYYTFDLGTYDTTIYANLVWNTVFGEFYHSSVLNRMHMGEHFSPVMFLFVPLYWIQPTALWLVAVQGLAVGIYYLLLIPLARRILSPDLAANRGVLAFVILLGIFSKPLNSALMFDFHPSTLTAPLIVLALIALHDRRDLTFWGCFAAICLCKENGALAGLSLGLYAGFVLGRWRMMLLVAGVSAIAAAVVFKVVMPTFQDESWGHLDRIGPMDLPLKKLEYLGLLLVVSAGLPLFAWRALIPVLPLIGLNLSVNYFRQLNMGYHYDDMSGVFLMAAVIHGLNRALPLVRSELPRAWLPAMAMTVLMLNLGMLSHRSITGIIMDFPNPKELALWHELQRYRPDSRTGILAFDPITPSLMNRARVQRLPSYVDVNDLPDEVARLQPGDLAMSSQIWQSDRHDLFVRLLDADPRLKRVRETDLLIVYERLPD